MIINTASLSLPHHSLLSIHFSASLPIITIITHSFSFIIIIIEQLSLPLFSPHTIIIFTNYFPSSSSLSLHSPFKSSLIFSLGSLLSLPRDQQRQVVAKNDGDVWLPLGELILSLLIPLFLRFTPS